MSDEKCPLCDGIIYVDKLNHTIWCDGQKHEFLCINNTYQSRKAIELKKVLTDKDIDWLLEPLDPDIDDGYCQSVRDKLEMLRP